MALKSKADLDKRLNEYFATLRSSSVGDALKHTAANWQIYAAVTGSAMALATNASAGVIYASGPITAGPVHSATIPNSNTYQSFGKFQLKTALGNKTGNPFSFGAYQKHTTGVNNYLRGRVRLRASTAGFLITSVNHSVAKLSAGVKISAHSPVANPIFEGGTNPIATQSIGNAKNSANGWARSVVGFAGFEFETAGSGVDYGWVRLEYTLGADGAASSVEAIDWAYATDGAAITTGEGIPSTPEPSTRALALLAAGAAGVAALRRRRKAAA